MNTHEYVYGLLSAYIDNAVSPQEQEQIETHLAACPVCRQELAVLKKMSTVLKQWKDETISPDLDQKIHSSLLTNHQEQEDTDMNLAGSSAKSRDFFMKAASSGGLVLVGLVALFVTQEYVRHGLQGKYHVVGNQLGDQWSSTMDRSTKAYDLGMTQSVQKPAGTFDSLTGSSSSYATRENLVSAKGSMSAREKVYDTSASGMVEQNKGFVAAAPQNLAFHGYAVASGPSARSLASVNTMRTARVDSFAGTAAYNNRATVWGSPMEYEAVEEPYIEPYQPYPPQRLADTYFQHAGVNNFVDTKYDHFSTFAIDVDTASYTVSRNYLKQGMLPPPDAVRVEEFVNYFDYQYPAPQRDTFAVYADMARSPLQDTFILRVGIKGKEVRQFERKPALLTFVVDVSGSMSNQDRLGLVKQALHLLVDHLQPQDKVAIVAYSDTSWVVLAHTDARQKYEIHNAIDSMHTVGSTNVQAGLNMGYQLASSAFKRGYINRVIVCSDGVANTGNVEPEAILDNVKRFTDKGIVLTAVGVGMNNYNDVLLEKIGDKGNGKYIYIDSMREAYNVFGQDLTGTLQFIAKDVKVQVDFNPAVVQHYRLLGYENRAVQDHQFRNDAVDGGEIGAGHAVTALYEIVLRPAPVRDRLATVMVRYKDIDTSAVREVAVPVRAIPMGFEQTPASFKLSFVAASFAEILRQSYWVKDSSLTDLRRIADDVVRAYYFEDQKAVELKDLIDQAYRLKAGHGYPYSVPVRQPYR